MDEYPSNSTKPPMGRGQRIALMRELNKRSEAAAQFTEIGQVTEGPTPTVAGPSASASDSPKPDNNHACKTSQLPKKLKPGIKCWTDATVDAVCNGKVPGSATAHASGSAAGTSFQKVQNPRKPPISTQAIWTRPKIPGHTSYRGYEVGYLDNMLERERDGPTMDEESWD